MLVFQTGICGLEISYFVSQFDWKKNTIASQTPGTGPSVDHTSRTASGYWLLMDSSISPGTKVCSATSTVDFVGL